MTAIFADRGRRYAAML